MSYIFILYVQIEWITMCKSMKLEEKNIERQGAGGCCISPDTGPGDNCCVHHK